MKRNIKTFLFISFSIALVSSTCLFSSCTKDEVKPAPNANGQYLNLNKGSLWDYTIDSAGNTSKVEVTDSIVMAFGKKFTNFHNTYPSGTVYRNFYAYQDGQYSWMITSAAGTQQELIYLKDNVKEGDKWSITVTPVSTPLLYEYEVIGIDGTRLVNSLTFTGVVRVRCSITSINYQSVAYYAPKVGLIELEEVYTTAKSSTKLKSYLLK
jgi:hypothetical protein